MSEKIRSDSKSGRHSKRLRSPRRKSIDRSNKSQSKEGVDSIQADEKTLNNPELFRKYLQAQTQMTSALRLRTQLPDKPEVI
ncbi:hypothetical protein LIX27_05810 [Leptospira borgpetersenii]|nr:hypothetical protein [Leptospira borgpetersenii]URD71392.1 hypothetical protein LIX26_05755 [Leptospira borgpetersenii]UVD74569.1 hypothetical protein NU962_05785 [Leptospira borgpetersenii]UVD77762.1 hypothetical protein LIX27_05810 [Leptospira borgpetersenii]UZW34332.1 hypothetical protein OR565_05810 [Leptospira borgpetersenii]